MKWSKLLLIILFSNFALNSTAQRIQFANNSPDNAFQGIDIYLNGMLIYDNLNFMNASQFIDIIPGVHTFDIAPDNSLSVNDAFYSVNFSLFPQDTIVAIASGTNTSAGYSPHKPFSLDFYVGAREIAKDPNNVDLLFANGTTDAGKIDFRTGIDTWVDDLDVGDITGYNEFVTNTQQVFRVTNISGSKRLGTYDLSPPSVWAGKSGIVLTTGFLNPSSNNNGPSFSTMIVFSDGGPFQPITTTIPEAYARVQLIHSSADTLADTVDVYVNNDLLLDDVPFLTATNFIDAPAKLPLDIGIARKNSLSSNDTFYNLNITFDSAGTYVLTTYGIESATGYIPAPPFSMKIYTQAKENISATGSTDILFMHASTDKPGFSIEQGGSNWQSNIYDGDFGASYITKPSNNYIITLKDATDPNDTLRYSANFQSAPYGNKVTTIVACGFKNPANNSNGLPFQLYAAIPEGGPLYPLTVVPPEPDNIITVNNNKVKIFPNPASDRLRITGLHASKKAAICFYTTLGTVAKTMTITGKDVYIGDLSNGIYLMCITVDGKQVQQLQLIKE